MYVAGLNKHVCETVKDANKRKTPVLNFNSINSELCIFLFTYISKVCLLKWSRSNDIPAPTNTSLAQIMVSYTPPEGTMALTETRLLISGWGGGHLVCHQGTKRHEICWPNTEQLKLKKKKNPNLTQKPTTKLTVMHC